MWTSLLICGVFLFGNVYSMTDAEIKEEFTKVVLRCTKKHPVDMQELFQLQKYIVPKKMETKCLLACTYKTQKLINDAGMYDVENGYKLAETINKGSETRIANGKKLVDVCSKVNEEPVTDGEKGCDRAALIFKCTVINGPKLGFKL